MDCLKILYQGKEHRLEELRAEQKMFEKSLEVPEYLQTDQAYDFVCNDPGYKLALGFLNDLYFQITSARFALLMGHKKIHDSNYVSWESGALGQLWLRSQYLRNSIIWYNSSYDLLWQAVWFGYSLFRKINFGKPTRKIQNINSKETFNKLLSSCNYSKVYSALELVEESEGMESAQMLLKEIESFNVSEQQTKIREWANSLKHRGSFKIKELYNPKSGLSIGTFDSNYTEPLLIEIDDIPDTLKEYHISFCNLVRFTFDFFDFQKMIPDEVDGKIPMAEIINEEVYKRIIIK